jgi:tetratricopeptide (TPR) repeat protein
MAIRGSLTEAGLPDVLQLLALGRKTGCLTVTHRASLGAIYFDQGRIVYASLVNRRDRLGDLLVRMGAVTAEQLQSAVTEQGRRPDRRIGDLLVERGALGADALQRCVRAQIEEAVYHLFTWTQGTFNFEPELRPESQDLLVSISAEALLLEGARRVDEWDQLRRRIPDSAVVFELDRARLARSESPLSAEQQAVVPWIDGTRDVAAITEASGLVEFEATKAMYGLLRAGFLLEVGRSAPAAATRASADRAAEHRTLGAAFQRTSMLEEALREYRLVADLCPQDAAAYAQVGLILIRLGRWAEAANVLGMATGLPDATGAMFHNLSYALERDGRPAKALEALRQAAQAGGVDAHRLRTSLGAVLLQRGYAAAAASALADARAAAGQATPSAPWYHHALLAAAAQGDYARAMEIGREAVAAHPGTVALHNNLAVLLEHTGAHAEARAMLEPLAGDDAPPQVFKNLGDLQYAAGDRDEAMASLTRAVSLAPDLGADAWLKLGHLHLHLGQHDDAVRCWDRALAVDPDNTAAQLALAALAPHT